MNRKQLLKDILIKLDDYIDKTVELPQIGSWPETNHVFEKESIWAIKAALAANRPLLVRGKPGTGKSQLARAAAFILNRVFIPEVVHARSESQDLMWHYDAVNRLGEAQGIAALAKEEIIDIKEVLKPERYLSPGVLWWAFDWDSAKLQNEKSKFAWIKPVPPEGWVEANGSVLLIDEIDKADADLPNGLLETLGNGAFPVDYVSKIVGLSGKALPPLVIITTNEERELPAAFLRRCFVLHLELPKEEEELVNWLMDRGKVHFEDECTGKVRRKAAEQLYIDRVSALKQDRPVPGQAEYLDILRALVQISKKEDEQLKVLEEIKDFALIKNSRDQI